MEFLKVAKSVLPDVHRNFKSEWEKWYFLWYELFKILEDIPNKVIDSPWVTADTIYLMSTMNNEFKMKNNFTILCSIESLEKQMVWNYFFFNIFIKIKTRFLKKLIKKSLGK